jgi:hypothetical protein
MYIFFPMPKYDYTDSRTVGVSAFSLDYTNLYLLNTKIEHNKEYVTEK